MKMYTNSDAKNEYDSGLAEFDNIEDQHKQDLIDLGYLDLIRKKTQLFDWLIADFKECTEDDKLVKFLRTINKLIQDLMEDTAYDEYIQYMLWEPVAKYSEIMQNHHHPKLVEMCLNVLINLTSFGKADYPTKFQERAIDDNLIIAVFNHVKQISLMTE